MLYTFLSPPPPFPRERSFWGHFSKLVKSILKSPDLKEFCFEWVISE
jgi:hypothetical protein